MLVLSLEFDELNGECADRSGDQSSPHVRMPTPILEYAHAIGKAQDVRMLVRMSVVQFARFAYNVLRFYQPRET